jgi:O-antigen ligase
MGNSSGNAKGKMHVHLQTTGVVVLFLASLSGQFSLSRLNASFESWGLLGEPRIWLISLLAIVAIPLIAEYKRNKEYEVAGKDYSGLFLLLTVLFNIYLILTYLWSPGSADSRAELVSLLLVIALMGLAYMIIRLDSKRAVNLFLSLLFAAALIYSIAGIVNLQYSESSGRFAFLWGGPNVYVRIVGAGAVIALYLWVTTKRKIWLLSIPLLLFSTVMSGSRGGIASFLIALLLAMVIIVKRVRRLLLVVAIIALLIVILVYMPFAASYKKFLQQRYFLTFENFSAEYERSRGNLFSDAWQAFSSAPLMGIGLNATLEHGHLYSHNIFLTVAAEGGLLGLIFLVVLLIPVVLRWKQERDLQTNTCLVLAAFFFMASLFSGSYYDWRFIWLFLLFYMMPEVGQTES